MSTEHETPQIYWRVGNGEKHSIPDGAHVFFLNGDEDYVEVFNDLTANPMLQVREPKQKNK